MTNSKDRQRRQVIEGRGKSGQKRTYIYHTLRVQCSSSVAAATNLASASPAAPACGVYQLRAGLSVSHQWHPRTTKIKEKIKK